MKNPLPNNRNPIFTIDTNAAAIVNTLFPRIN
jgi:hypothetical protein